MITDAQDNADLHDDADETADNPPADGAKPAEKPITVPKQRLDREIAKRRQMEADLAALADEILTDVPEAFKPLIPKGMTPIERLKWFREAVKAGAFKEKRTIPATDTARASVTPKERDYSQLPVHARMAAGYGKG